MSDSLPRLINFFLRRYNPGNISIGDVPTWDGDDFAPAPGGGGGGGTLVGTQAYLGAETAAPIGANSSDALFPNDFPTGYHDDGSGNLAVDEAGIYAIHAQFTASTQELGEFFMGILSVGGIILNSTAPIGDPGPPSKQFDAVASAVTPLAADGLILLSVQNSGEQSHHFFADVYLLKLEVA